jgi:hypothetical protein
MRQNASSAFFLCLFIGCKKGCRVMKNNPRICCVDGCKGVARANNTPYCEKHYYRIRRNGTIELKHKPHKTIHSGGYVLIPAIGHPLTIRHTNNTEYEHRFVYYNHCGEGPFNCHWCGKEVTWDTLHIDHLNNCKTDNRIDNLVASCPVCNQQRGHEKLMDTVRRKHGLEYNGRIKTINEWARDIGIKGSSLRLRLANGWPLERALTEPRGRTGPKQV